MNLFGCIKCIIELDNIGVIHILKNLDLPSHIFHLSGVNQSILFIDFNSDFVSQWLVKSQFNNSIWSLTKNLFNFEILDTVSAARSSTLNIFNLVRACRTLITMEIGMQFRHWLNLLDPSCQVVLLGLVIAITQRSGRRFSCASILKLGKPLKLLGYSIRWTHSIVVNSSWSARWRLVPWSICPVLGIGDLL